MSRILGVAALGALFLAGSPGAEAAEAVARELVPVSLKVGFSTTGFVQGNINDIEAAFKALAETIGRKQGFRVTVKTRLFTDAHPFYTAVEAGEINLAVFDSLAFVAMPHSRDMTPVFIATNEGAPGRHYLVLVRRDRGLRNLDDLRGKRFMEYQAPSPIVGHTWLLSRLLASGRGSPEQFFGSVELVARPSAAVLPVFFGRQDACLVDDIGFKLMTELNPQVGAQLQSVEVSASLVGAVVCISKSNWSAPDFPPVLVKALGDLNGDPAGRQILTLFKIDRLVPFEDAQLETARELSSAYVRQLEEVRP